MKNNFLILTIVAIILLVVVAAPVLNAVKLAPSPAMPFVGMSMVYYANTNWNEFVERSVVVVKYNAQNNSVLIQDGTDYYTVDIATRMITSATGWFTRCVDICAVEIWIPTNVKIGSVVNVNDQLAEVVGSKLLSVEGKAVDCWQLYAAWTDSSTGSPVEDNWYYAKSTGLWIGASWYELDVNGNVVNHWTGHLASTNVPL